MKIILIHGTFGSPEENWFPWMKEELEQLGHQVAVPRFPTPQNQSIETWRAHFYQYETLIDEDSILIGHSLGVAFLLDSIKRSKSIRTVFLVSGFTGLLGEKTFDDLNKTFVQRDIQWKAIKKKCTYFFVYHSDNDPYVPITYATELAQKLEDALKK